MSATRESRPRNQCYSVRYQARLDAETHAKLQELVAVFHRKPSPILRCVMGWGITLTKGWIIDRSRPPTVHTVAILVEPDLLHQVQDAAGVPSAPVAAWVWQ